MHTLNVNRAKLLRLCTKHMHKLTAVILLAFFIVNTSFIRVRDVDKTWAMLTITITGSDASTGELIMSDHGKTEAERKQKINWKIDKNSGVKAITGITVKDGSTNVFDPEPRPLGNSGNWQGTVSPDIEVPAEELYNIIWTDQDDNEHVYDPKIQVKSK